MASWQPYDLFLLAVLAVCTLYGGWKGMIWQLASLASIILSAVVASRFGGALAPYISHHTPWNRFLAMLVLYAGTSLAIWLAFRPVAVFINRLQLKEFDRQLGALLGAAKGVLLCVVITFFTVMLSEPARQAVLHSRSGYYVALFTNRAVPILPEEVRTVLGRYLQELDRKLDPKTPPDPSRQLPGGNFLPLPGQQPGQQGATTGWPF